MIYYPVPWAEAGIIDVDATSEAVDALGATLSALVLWAWPRQTAVTRVFPLTVGPS